VRANAEVERICSNLSAKLTAAAFSFPQETFYAKAAYVYDFSTKTRLYGKDESLALPLASLTKLMTVRIALKSDALDDFYTIAPGDLSADGFVGFVESDSYRIRDLIKAALIASSNDAASMLARSTGLSQSAFLEQMDVEAKHLGLGSLAYASVTGLDTADLRATASGSAADIAQLLYKDYEEYPDIFSLSAKEGDTIRASSGRSIDLANTDLAASRLALLMASKTGYTTSAGGNLAVLWQEPRGDILGGVVLGSTTEGRFSDMIALHDSANIYLNEVHTMLGVCTQSRQLK